MRIERSPARIIVIDTRQIGHLLAVVEHRHFRKAAHVLGLSQPALSKSIQKLEAELGARLLERRRQGVALTAVGKAVVERGREVVARMDQLAKEVGRMVGSESGALAIGVGPAMAETFVSAVIGQFAQRWPAVQVDVRMDNWAQLSEWLDAGALDLYIADTTRLGRDARLTVIPMPQEPVIWFCRAGHPLAGRRSVEPRQLLEFPLAVSRPPHWAQVWLAAAAGEPQDVQQRFHSVQCESYSMTKQMVRASNCVSAAIESAIAQELAAGVLKVLPVRRMKMHTSAGIVYRNDRALPPAGERFIELVQAAARTRLPAKKPRRG